MVQFSCVKHSFPNRSMHGDFVLILKYLRSTISLLLLDGGDNHII